MAAEHHKADPQFPGLVFNSDGSVTRTPSPMFPELPPAPDGDPLSGVASRDIILNPDFNLWVRLFLPKKNSASVQEQPSPIIINFHGGGFTMLTAATAQMHTLCNQLASRVPSIVISVNYRLAPEHRLPAAYEDGCSVLTWLDEIRQKKVPSIAASAESESSWLNSADFSKVFVAGDSAGGNLAHHVAVRASELYEAKGLSFKLAGQILLQPYFGGVERTESEVKLGQGPVITTPSCDFSWKLALPEGADRDHAFCNPMKSELRAALKKLGGGKFVAKTMVVVGGMDLLKDRQFEYARLLEEEGQNVKLVVYPNGVHGFYVFPGSPESPHLLDEMVAFCTS